ncbi:MAG: phage holin family protein [Aestuariivirga sp.]
MPERRAKNTPIFELVKKLLMGALGWSSDELSLTKLDAKALLNRVLLGAGLLFFAFAMLTAAIFTLAETLIGALTDYLHGNFAAGLVVTVGLLLITALLMAFAYSSIKATPAPRGVIFKRLLGSKKLP